MAMATNGISSVARSVVTASRSSRNVWSRRTSVFFRELRCETAGREESSVGNTPIPTDKDDWFRSFRPASNHGSYTAPRRKRRPHRSTFYRSFSTAAKTNVDSNGSGNGSGSENLRDAADKPATTWMHMYALLEEYRWEHKTTIVPEYSNDETHRSIARWVVAQRKRHKSLSVEQKELLNKIGFVWDYQEARWLEQYERLCDYESKLPKTLRHGSDLESIFEKRYHEDPVLKRWVNAQRLKYRKESISAERVRLLDQVEGFFWDVKEARWAEMYRRLSLYAQQNNGSCMVPQNYKDDPQLACWVSNQRQRRKQLTSERIQLLNALGFVWDVREIQWLETYDKYKAMFFSEKHDDGKGSHADADADIDSGEEHKQLTEWAIKQRRCYRNGTLSAYRVQRMEELEHPADGHGFVWDPHDQNWIEMYLELEEFRSKHNHVMVPTRSNAKHEANDSTTDDETRNESLQPPPLPSSSPSSKHRQLGIWAANQRRAFKTGVLSEKRTQLLDDIGFVWDVPKAQWEDSYRRLVEYQKQQMAAGKEASVSTMVPQHYEKDPQLAIWVKEQRQCRKHGSLPSERQRLLDEIGFVWEVSSSPSSTSS
mmetsp:Transcript_28255/g.76559  ORF Transcript_28255/g.76559 Transcript_28255/m.76559 type:complete len:597 (+) Transcript_28255:160-1950(+)